MLVMRLSGILDSSLLSLSSYPDVIRDMNPPIASRGGTPDLTVILHYLLRILENKAHSAGFNKARLYIVHALKIIKD